MERTESEILEWLHCEHAHPFHGWDFSHLNGRLIAPDMHKSWDLNWSVGRSWGVSTSIIDIDTGGGERMAEWIKAFGHRKRMVATEAWPPNVPLARQHLGSLGVDVVQAPASMLPFRSASFDMVTNRHGELVAAEVFRLLRPGGWLVTQQVGSATNREIRRWFRSDTAEASHLGRTTGSQVWDLSTARRQLEAAGFSVECAEEASHICRFTDAGAMAYYLKAVRWEVPDFDVDRYAEQLLSLHRHIEATGYFESSFHQFLLVARSR